MSGVGGKLHYENENDTGLMNSGSCDPLLQRREQSEHRYIREVAERHTKTAVWLPWQMEEPFGVDALIRLGTTVQKPVEKTSAVRATTL